MTTRVDIEEIEATKSEKFLAVILAAFLLIGSIWFYVNADDWIPGGDDWNYTAAEQKVVDRQNEAFERSERADEQLERERSELSLAKNRLDIALAKGGDTSKAEATYAAAEGEFESASARADEAQRAVREAESALARIDKAHQAKSEESPHEWIVAGVRLGFIVVLFVGSLRIVSTLRRRQSRFMPLGFASVGTGVITALVFATDYITDYIDPLDLGPIVLSAVGAAATIASFVALQRWLARRIPGRRVRNGECPFCGHPVRHGGAASGSHCEGCGRDVIAPCASCSESRRVGSSFCAHCGAE
jgi:hypothetical protein